MEARDWYTAVDPNLGGSFFRELEKAVEQARRNPQAFEIVFRDVRRVLLRRFPYALFYRLMPQAIVVIAFFHGSRNPKRWQGR